MSRHGIIDVGSNAIRMLLIEQDAQGSRELARERAPVRLGAGVFRDGEIEAETLSAAAETFAGFAATFAAAGVDTVTALATAAAREAKNQTALRDAVRQASGIELRIIDGEAEARLLADTMRAHLPLDQGRSLLLDLGAGSVEQVLVQDGHLDFASYPLGSLRLLAEVLPPGAADHGPDFLARLEAQVCATVPGSGPVERFAVCGGSLDRLVKLIEAAGGVHQSAGLPALRLETLRQHSEALARCSRAERIDRHGLEPDRADTLVPAAAVTLALGERASAGEVLVPRIDLKDGIAWRLRQGHAPI